MKTSNGTSYWGNNGLVSGPASTAGGGANDRDTEETVILSNAPVGLTEVTVRATGVRRDGHVETGALDVDFALVVEGLRGMRDRSGLALDVSSAQAGDLSVSVRNLPGGWDQGFTLFSLNTTRPVSTGNLLGLEFDALAGSLLALPSAPGDVFHFTPGSASQYPRAPFRFPTGVAVVAKGLTLDAVLFLMNRATVVAVSNVDRVTVQ